MSSQRHVHNHVRLAFYMNDFATVFRRFPSFRRAVLAVRIKCLNINVFHRRTDVGEAPGNVLIVSNDHVGQAGKSHASNVEIAGAGISAAGLRTAKMRFVP